MAPYTVLFLLLQCVTITGCVAVLFSRIYLDMFYLFHSGNSEAFSSLGLSMKISAVVVRGL